MANDDQGLKCYFEYVVENEGLVYPPSGWNDGRRMFEVIIRNARC